MEAWIGSAVIAVVISSLVTVAGWFMTLRHERLREIERRQERIEDIQTALLADIRSSSHRFSEIDLDRHAAEMKERIAAAGPGESYTPFVPREPGSLLWSTTAGEIHILPNEVIDAVVIYFSQLETLRLFIDDLRGERFAALDSARKIAMYADYINMAKYLLDLAREAERILSLSLKLERPPSSPASDRFAPSTASGSVSA